MWIWLEQHNFRHGHSLVEVHDYIVLYVYGRLSAQDRITEHEPLETSLCRARQWVALRGARLCLKIIANSVRLARQHTPNQRRSQSAMHRETTLSHQCEPAPDATPSWRFSYILINWRGRPNQSEEA